MLGFLGKMARGVGLILFAFLAGCQTTSTPAPDEDLAQLPPPMPTRPEKVQIGDDKGKPVYALGGVRRQVQRVSYQPAAQLHAGRFAYPDYSDPDLVARINTAFEETFAEPIVFVSHSSRSYTYETPLRPTWTLKRKVRGLVEDVAAEQTMARPGRDGKWRPDYGRIAREAKLDVPSDLATKVAASGLDRRSWVGALADHVQKLPYGIPPNGFLFPDEVLRFNYGDCDSKAVLAAALIERVDPDLDYAFIDLPQADHLLLGVVVEPRDGDHTVRAKGKTYVLVEISGPAVLPLGDVAPRSAVALAKHGATAILRSGRAVAL